MNTKDVQGNSCKSGSCGLKGGCKAKLVFIIALVLACGAYVGFWHYQAGIIKANVEEKLANPAFSEVKYEAVSVKGFPLEYNVEIQKPYMQFEHGGKNFKIEIDNIVAGSKISDRNKYKASIGNVTITGDFAGKEDKKEEFIENINFNVPPVIEITLDDGEGISSLTSVSYKDEGFSILIDGKNIGSMDRMSASFKRGDLDGNKHFYDLKASYQTGKPADVKNHPMLKELPEETLKKLNEMSAKFGKANADFDITLTYTGPKNLDMEDTASIASLEGGELNIGKVSFKTEDGLGYDLSGNVKMDKTSPMPFVDFKLTLFSVDELFVSVNEFMQIVPEILEQTGKKGLPQVEKDAILAISKVFKDIDEKSLEDAKAFLYEISDNPTEKTKDVTISIKSQADGSFKIGTLNAMEIEALFNKRFPAKEKVSVEEPEVSVTVPDSE